MKDKIFGGIFGFIVGDALGVPVEFTEREVLAKNPVTDMIGFKRLDYPSGTWSDDSSLTLCLIDSIINNYTIDELSKRFVDWYENGYWTPFGKAFDIGKTTGQSIELLKTGVSPFESGRKGERDNGNGALMRILPLAFYIKNKQLSERVKIIDEITSITHAHIRSKIASVIYIELIIQLLNNKGKYLAYENTKKIILNDYSKNNQYTEELHHFDRILHSDIGKLHVDDIKSTGYVVSTLEAAVWSFLQQDSYKSTVLTAVNLGNDTDTIAAIAGSLAGVYYGYNSINKNWINQLARKEDIFNLVERFYERVNKK